MNYLLEDNFFALEWWIKRRAEEKKKEGVGIFSSSIFRFSFLYAKDFVQPVFLLPIK